MKRASLSLLAALFTLLILEAGFRLRYPTLPSLSALESEEAKSFWGHERPPIATSPENSSLCQDPPGETRSGSAHVAPPVRIHLFGKDANPEPNILVAGDSIAWGYGVETEEAWGAILGHTLQESLQRSLTIGVVGIPGGGYCEILRGIHRELDATPPEVVVLQVFADDLEQRAMMLVGGAPVAYPSQASSPTTRALTTHSYLLNWGWSHWISRKQDTPSRFISTEGQDHFQQAMANLRMRCQALGTQLVVFQVQPAGIESCSSRPAQSCQWYLEDQTLMTSLLQEAGIQAIDLSTLWDHPDRWLLEKERMRMQRELQYVGIHPNPLGHARLAEILAEPTAKALSK